jgi:hypothetical protein
MLRPMLEFLREDGGILRGVPREVLDECILCLVFGPVAKSLAKAAKRAPVTVRVMVADDAKALMFWPFELAHGGQATRGPGRNARDGGGW